MEKIGTTNKTLSVEGKQSVCLVNTLLPHFGCSLSRSGLKFMGRLLQIAACVANQTISSQKQQAFTRDQMIRHASDSEESPLVPRRSLLAYSSQNFQGR